MVIKWDKFRGEMKGDSCEALIEMMDLPEPFWEARFSWLLPESTSHEIKAFEEGKLEQAYNWCIEKIKEHELRLRQRGYTAS
jgi:hypothetical protein